MYRRPEIMVEAREGQFHGTRAPTGLGLGFEDLNLEPRARQNNCRSQSVRTRPNHTSLLVVYILSA